MVNIMSLVPGDIVRVELESGIEREVRVTDHPRKFRGHGRDEVRVSGRTLSDDMLTVLDGDPDTEVYVVRTEPVE